MEMRGARRAGVVVPCGLVTFGTPFVGGIRMEWSEKETLNKQSVTCQTVPGSAINSQQRVVTWALCWV